MARGGHGLPKVSPRPTMPDPSMPCRRATPETTLQLFLGWPANRAGGLRPSSTLLDTPSHTGLVLGLTILSHHPSPSFPFPHFPLSLSPSPSKSPLSRLLSSLPSPFPIPFLANYLLTTLFFSPSTSLLLLSSLPNSHSMRPLVSLPPFGHRLLRRTMPHLLTILPIRCYGIFCSETFCYNL
jgi:hypothetical protein